MLSRIFEFVREQLHLDERDRAFNDKFKDSRELDTRRENDELDERIRKHKHFLGLAARKQD